ncbi:GGDEF domain-containing protein [Cognaticolwellia beringensis]|uniref:diguanylate cyclase n=1 Tax=Cognaticolwellia beringensis TaxID=1967665 RepID=A0A222GAE5_9GAMM|nr:GGDEF domain-containing protein [Cognaticolwellia beringensis]ASP48354.1 GGDEF domain-containing protein [Cognaticolwellia beringensis]
MIKARKNEYQNAKSEVNFSHFLMHQCLGMRRWALTVALLLYIVFAIMDVLKFPSEVYSLTLTTRIILVIAPLIYLNVLYWFFPPISIRSNLLILLLVYIGSGLNHSLIYYLSDIYGLQFSELGMVLILMFGCLLLVIPIKPAVFATFIILAVFSAVNVYINSQLADLIFVLIILSFVSGICLTINLIGQKTLYKNYLLINRLYNESITDGLTKLHNKRSFQEEIERLNAIATRDNATLGLILIDADDFKIINDSFGHAVGDDVLIKIAQVIEAKCRRVEDIGFRVGGDEFALILYGINDEKLEQTCFEIVKNVTNFNIKYNRQSVKTSVSLGAVLKSANAKISSDNLTEIADEYLYEAKENGRNQYYLKTFQ